jgi:hypothetical protein
MHDSVVVVVLWVCPVRAQMLVRSASSSDLRTLISVEKLGTRWPWLWPWPATGCTQQATTVVIYHGNHSTVEVQMSTTVEWITEYLIIATTMRI